jgi:dTDP-glucose pyrophosphorylase
MLNILIPLSGKNTFKVNELNAFPRILNDVDGKLLIERAAKPFINLDCDKLITVAIPKEDAEKYQLSKVVSHLAKDINICKINDSTQGAACSALLAIENLDLDSPLIISSFEQVLDFDISEHINNFIECDVDAGVFTFEAIHPKWSFVKTDRTGTVIQAAEKIPISNQAIAGLYYFKTARMFFEATKSMIRKDVKTNGSFYISPTLNEIILREGVVKAIEIDKDKYFHISDDHALESYELKVSDQKAFLKKEILNRTKKYITAFDNKNLAQIEFLFSTDFTLKDPNVSITGKEKVLTYINDIFKVKNELSFIEKNIHVTDELCSIIEFELEIDNQKFIGTDVIQWNTELLMLNMNAYLYEKSDG